MSYQEPYQEQQPVHDDNSGDGMADSYAVIGIIVIVVSTVVYWLKHMPM